MPFNASLPEWNKTALAPSATKKNEGWAAGEHPPASIFDWFFNTVYLSIKELQEEAINADQKAVANGVATLDANADLPIGQADNILNWVKGFGLGDVAKNIDNTDLNALDATGFYKGSTLTNAPAGATGTCYVINIKEAATYKRQILMAYTTNSMFIRYNNNGVWGSWIQFAQYDANGKVAIANLPAATTAAAGIAQLADSITDTSTSKAATANSVKLLADWVKSFGLGDVTKDISGTDLNNLDTTGFYKGGTLTNAPAAGNWFIINLKNSATFKSQIAILQDAASTTYIRYNNAGVWGAWVQLAAYDSNGKIPVANLPGATTAAAGIAQLVDSINATDVDKAATANSVKMLQDWVKGFGVGDVAKALANGTDLNTLDGTGFYRVFNSLNAPAANTWYFILNIKHDSNHKVQIASRFASSNAEPTYIRTCNSGTWNAWQQLAMYDANGKVATANLPDATTAAKGITQLNDTITSTSTSQAATANAVKSVVDWVKGLGLGDIAKDISNTDLNNLDVTGFYKGATLTNAPTATQWYYIIHIKHSSVYKTQIAIFLTNGTPTTYQRNNNNGVWSAWIQNATLDANGDLPIDQADNILNWVKGYGIGTDTPRPSDLNTTVESGFYYATNTCLNTPISGNWFKVMVIGNVDCAQVAFGISALQTYFRTRNNGTWSAWKQLVITDQGSWTQAVLQNGWQHSGGCPVEYRLNQLGQLEIRGACQGGTVAANTTLFTIPTSLLTTKQKTFNVTAADSTGGLVPNVVMWIHATTGAVNLYNTGAYQIYFDGKVFTK